MENSEVSRKIHYGALYFTFLKIGATTFGGGYAMIPLIQREIVETRKWIDEKEFLDAIAITNSLPGPLAANCAVYTGYRLKGYLGAFVTVLGVITPSFFIILLLALSLAKGKDNPMVIHAFKGLRPAVAGLIGYSLIKMAKTNGFTAFNLILSFFIFAVVCFGKINPVWAILFAAALGLFMSKFHKEKEAEKK